MTSERPNFCARCGVPLKEGNVHDEAAQCIAELRLSLKRQAQAAENLSFEVSTRLFGILEGLAHDPSVAGIRFSSHNHDTGEKTELSSQVVAGVMTAILREYQKAGDWSPLADAKKAAGEYRAHAYKLFSLLNSVVALFEDKEDMESPLVNEIVKALEAATQHGVHLPGPHHS